MRTLISNATSKIPSLLREGIFLLFLAALIGTSAGCDSKGLTLVDAARIGEGRVLLAVRHGKANGLVTYQEGGAMQEWNSETLRADMGNIIRLSKLSDSLIAATTEKSGIYLYTVNQDGSSAAPTHIPVGEGALVDRNIRGAYYYDYDNIRRLYVIYGTPKGSGVTEVALKEDNTVAGYNHLDANSSELKSNNVLQVEPDIKGNVWFNYSKKEERGVSRLSPKGEWSHFDRDNSELPDKHVRLIRAEGPGEGIDGDNVWFASLSGLTRLEYKSGEKEDEEKEKWRLYGERETTSGLIARAIGVRDLVSDAVLDIIDMQVIDKYIILANRKGVYTFNGKSMNRFMPGTLGGIQETQVSDINYRDGYVVVKTRSAGNQYQYVDSVNVLDLKKRKWTKIKHWDIARDYPNETYFIPFKKSIDLVTLKYQDNKTIFAFFNYETMELKKIDMSPFTGQLKTPAAEAEKTVSEPEQAVPAPAPAQETQKDKQ